MIIDMRVRPPYGAFLQSLMYAARDRTAEKARSHGFDPPGALAAGSYPLFLEELDAAGIDLAVVPGRCAAAPWGNVSNDDLAGLVAAGKGRLVGFASLDADAPGAVAELDRAIVQLGLCGLALDTGFAPRPHAVNDPALAPLYERCVALDVPVMLTMSASAGPTIEYANAAHLDAVAAAYPSLRIIVAHAGWPFVLDVIGVAYRRPNVWLSPDEYFIRMPGAEHWVTAANGFLRSRLLFGSSYPFTPMRDAVEYYRAAPFRTDVLPAVLGHNAAALLRRSAGIPVAP